MASRRGWSADRPVTGPYPMYYRALVRLAALLVRDVQTAEEVVQDSLVAMHGGWQRVAAGSRSALPDDGVLSW